MLALICGLPRAGKTTYSSRYYGRCEVLHCDYLQTWGVLHRIRHLPDDEDVVVEGVYREARSRKELAGAYHGKKVCIWLDTPLEIRKTRPGFYKESDTHFDPPTLAEGWDKVITYKYGEIDYFTK
jgi:predicted kinase